MDILFGMSENLYKVSVVNNGKSNALSPRHTPHTRDTGDALNLVSIIL